MMIDSQSSARINVPTYDRPHLETAAPDIVLDAPDMVPGIPEPPARPSATNE